MPRRHLCIRSDRGTLFILRGQSHLWVEWIVNKTPTFHFSDSSDSSHSFFLCFSFLFLLFFFSFISVTFCFNAALFQIRILSFLTSVSLIEYLSGLRSVFFILFHLTCVDIKKIFPRKSFHLFSLGSSEDQFYIIIFSRLGHRQL